MATLGDDLLGTVNKLQDLVFNTIGNDSLDLPQIVCHSLPALRVASLPAPTFCVPAIGRSRFPVGRKVVGSGKHSRSRFSTPRQRHRHQETSDSPADQRSRERSRRRRLRQLPELTAAGRDEWAEFHHIPNRRFTDFGDVKREIENETARVAGSNKGINRQPINLKIYSLTC